jgi:IS30 family transposase
VQGRGQLRRELVRCLRAGRTALGALVERTIRLTPLLHLPDGKSAEQTEVAMRAVIPVLPASLTRTITWD